jgi:hypothetical protein
VLEKAELTLIKMLSKTKKVFTTPPPVLCSIASYKLFYSTKGRVETLSLLFVSPLGGGMEIKMETPISQVFPVVVSSMLDFVYNCRTKHPEITKYSLYKQNHLLYNIIRQEKFAQCISCR